MAYQIITTMQDKSRLLHYLQTYHRGQGKAIKMRDLLAAIYGADAAQDRSTNNPDNRKLRKMIEELINEGEPICSSASSGYWYADSLEDGLNSVTENESRALTQLANTRKLKQNILDKFGGQMGLMI